MYYVAAWMWVVVGFPALLFVLLWFKERGR